MSDTPAAHGGAAPPPSPPVVNPPEPVADVVELTAPPAIAVPRESGFPELDHFRTLGHWLGLAEADDGTPASREAGAAYRLYCLAQMDLPWQAAQELTVIRGKLTMSANLLRILAQRAGLRIERVDDSAESCTAVLIHARTGEEIGRSTFTIEQAKRAGLLRAGTPWITYPERMLWARASAYAIRDHAGHVALGLQLADEAEEAYARGAEPIGVDHYAHEPTEADEDIPF